MEITAFSMANITMRDDFCCSVTVDGHSVSGLLRDLLKPGYMMSHELVQIFALKPEIMSECFNASSVVRNFETNASDS